jgi:hypothetical protein
VGKKTPFLQFQSKESLVDSMAILDPDLSSEDDPFENSYQKNKIKIGKIEDSMYNTAPAMIFQNKPGNTQENTKSP